MLRHISRFAAAILLFIAAIGWHLYLIATLRPQFSKLSDKASTVGSFFLVYLMSGMVRWSILEDRPTVNVFIGLLVHALILWAAFKRPLISSSLVTSMLGASATIDLIAIALHLANLHEANRAWPLFAFECFLYAVCFWRFSREPETVRRALVTHPEK